MAFLLRTHGLCDLAIIAHQMPIVSWARLVWDKVIPREELGRALAWAQARCGRGKGWRACSGPSQAFVLTLERLGWTADDAIALRTDTQKIINLAGVPQCVVGRYVRAAVARWTWARVATEHHEPTRAYPRGGGFLWGL